MIPRKISLEGFLSYQDRQEIDLDGFKLAMLCGPNGSGKSSVFDAITFALFGHHRAGAMGVSELINKRVDKAIVEFEFEHDGVRWQIYRTIRRSGRSAAEAREWDPSIPGWRGVATAGNIDGLKQWVDQTLNLKVGAFIRSVLLRQGEADKVLAKEPKDRFEVLAGVVDLKRYRELEDHCREHLTLATGTAKSYAAQLSGMPAISELELAAATQAVDQARSALELADTRVHAAMETLNHAKLWLERSAKLEEALSKQRRLADLLVRAEQVSADFARWSELTAVLPGLSNYFNDRQRQHRCQRSLDRLMADLEKSRVQQAKLAEAVRSTEVDQSALEASLAASEPILTKLAVEIAGLQSAVKAAEELQRQRAELAGMEKQLESMRVGGIEPPAALAEARARVERLNMIAAIIPSLDRLQQERSAATAARETANKLTAALTDAKSLAERQQVERDRLLVVSGEADVLAQEARRNETEVQAFASKAKSSLSQLEDAGQSPLCPACGQELTEDHLASEMARRQAELADWTSKSKAATAARKQAEKALVAERKKLDKAVQAAQSAATALQSVEHSVATATAEIARAESACEKESAALFALAAGMRGIDPAFPDVTRLKSEVALLPAARRLVEEASTRHDHWRELKIRAESLRERLSTQSSAPSESGTVLAGRLSEGLTLQQQISSQIAIDRKRAGELREARKRSAADLTDMSTKIAATEREHAAESRGLEEIARAIEQGRRVLPEVWLNRAGTMSSTDLAALQSELARLAAGGIEATYVELANARSTGADLARLVTERQAEVAAIPESARVSPEHAEAQLNQAKVNRLAADRARQSAEAARERLETDRARRQTLEQSLLQTEKRQRHLKRLAELLGKRGLQMHLLRQAEREIVESTNGILDRLSGGELRLRLKKTAADDSSDLDPSENALDLEALNELTAGAEPIGVQFLSGSQRFRVAVSLALAVGKYGGHQRGSDCVLIDEGFGSLDADGQQVMIQELNRLQGILNLIVLVSHQESFAAAFTDGYRFRLEDGQSRVTRMGGV